MTRMQPVDGAELRALSHKYGKPQRVTFNMSRLPLAPGKSGNRRAEVVLVICSGRNKVLLHTKSFYPDGVFRLLSGGIRWDESVESALLREAKEETGLDVSIERFVALIQYGSGRTRQPFASYVFLLDGGQGRPSLPRGKERITAFKAVSANGLRITARALRSLPLEWRAWGEFRALAHEIAAGAIEARAARPDADTF
jgi:ADP-ribose pyrophosphatase YjhB (NUDIX family)